MNNLAKFRTRVGLTQRELGQAAGFGDKQQSRIGNYESGLREPGLDECRVLVNALVELGATNDAGAPVTLDDVFPPEQSAEPIAANS